MRAGPGGEAGPGGRSLSGYLDQLASNAPTIYHGLTVGTRCE